MKAFGLLVGRRVPSAALLSHDDLLGAGLGAVLHGLRGGFRAGGFPPGPLVVVDRAACLPPALLPVAVAAGLAACSAGTTDVLVATLPVTDTLKWVDDAGAVRGTADRDRYRVPVSPIVLPHAVVSSIGVAALDALPHDTSEWSAGALLRALVEAGARVVRLPDAPGQTLGKV